jgi:hypothetical protein
MGCMKGLSHQDIDNSLLETRDQISEMIFRITTWRFRISLDVIDNSSFQAAETEVQGIFLKGRPWKPDRLRISLLRKCIDNRSSWIPQS